MAVATTGPVRRVWPFGEAEALVASELTLMPMSGCRMRGWFKVIQLNQGAPSDQIEYSYLSGTRTTSHCCQGFQCDDHRIGGVGSAIEPSGSTVGTLASVLASRACAECFVSTKKATRSSVAVKRHCWLSRPRFASSHTQLRSPGDASVVSTLPPCSLTILTVPRPVL